MKIGWEGIETMNPEGTVRLGEDLSKYLERGDVLALIGELASGKTTFIQGMMRGLHYTKSVTSPTFTLVNEYDAIYSIIHIECYREENIQRWIQLGIHDYINEDNIVIIEWADKVPSLLPDDHIQIDFMHKGFDKREIILH